MNRRGVHHAARQRRGWVAARCPRTAESDAGDRRLGSASAAADGERLTLIRQALAEAGFTEGRTVAMEYRWAEGQPDRLPALAVELVSRRVDVIIATGGLQVPRAAMSTTSTIGLPCLRGDRPFRAASDRRADKGWHRGGPRARQASWVAAPRCGQDRGRAQPGEIGPVADRRCETTGPRTINRLSRGQPGRHRADR